MKCVAHGRPSRCASSWADRAARRPLPASVRAAPRPAEHVLVAVARRCCTILLYFVNKRNFAMSKNLNYPFTEAQVIKLLRLYKKEELLWNKNLSAYKDRNLRRTAMRRILRALDMPKLDVKHVTFRVRMLRDMYVRELKKIGLDSAKYGRSFPYWFYRMHFLKDHLNTAVDLSGIQIKQYTKEEEMYFGLEDDSDSCAGDLKEDRPSSCGPGDTCVVKAEDDRGEFGPPSASRPKPDDSQSDGRSSPGPADRDARTPSAGVVRRAILGLLDDERAHRQTDYFDNFAKYVASLLRALPKTRAFELQPKIIGMITAEHRRLSEPTDDAANAH